MVNYKKLLMLIAACGLCSVAQAEVEVTGDARVRYESKNNTDFNKDVSDYTGKTASRFRLNFLAKPTDKSEVFIQPQINKTWGAGATFTDFNQAYITMKPKDGLAATFGRQTLSYGDELVVGASDWGTGLSFDAVKVRKTLSSSWVDVFHANVVDANTAAAGTDDTNFYGVYYGSTHFGLKAFDAYALINSVTTAGTEAKSSNYGLRVKSDWNKFDYRVEYVSQDNDGTVESLADVELGYMINDTKNMKVNFEYAMASKGYTDLYSTAHKWLGIADVVTRTNVTDMNLGFAMDLRDDTNLAVAYHMFSRSDDAVGVNVAGSGSDKAIGSEIDVTVTHNCETGMKISLMAAQFMPGAYVKNAGSSDATSFFALQVGTAF